MSIQDYLKSSDPLSAEAMDFLIEYKEEDQHVDYKEDFDFDSEKEWIGITKDAMAFANTCGGYLVFGVQDVTYKLLGLKAETVKILDDITRIHAKLNRYISPHITSLRTRPYIKGDKTFVIVCIPESIGKTHIVIKECKIRYPKREGQKREEKILLRPGNIFLRISGSNQIITPEGFEFIVNNRVEQYIEQYKELMLENIVRVVNAPIEDEILIGSIEAGEGGEKEFIVSDAPDAIPIKGMCFSVTPKTDEQEITAFIALSDKNHGILPPSQELWRFYSRRHELSLNILQLHAMAKFCLLLGVPAFFWAKEFSAADFKDILEKAIVSTVPDFNERVTMVKTGAFLGKGFKSSLIKKLGKASKRLSSHTKRSYISDPQEFFSSTSVEPMTKEHKESEAIHRNSLEEEVSKLAIELSENDNDAMKKNRAVNIDCCLYARNDNYLPSKKS